MLVGAAGMGIAAATQFRRPGAPTMTTTKKLHRKPIQSPPTGLSNSKTVLRYPKMKGAKMLTQLAPSDVLTEARTGFAQSPYNEQATREEVNMQAIDLANIYSKSVDTTIEYENTADFLAKTYERKFWIDDFYKETLITNQSPSVVKLVIWDLIAKEDTNESPIAAWVTGVNAESGLDVPQNVDVPMARPSDVREFNRTWKVINVRQIELGTGRCHQHVFHHRYNGWISVGKLLNNNRTNFLKGITSFTLIQTMGVPVDSQNAWQILNPSDEIIPPAIGIDRTKIVWVSNMKTRSRVMNVKSKKLTYTQFQLGDISGNAFVQQENSTGVLDTVVQTVFS